jgi:flagellar FliL protein
MKLVLLIGAGALVFGLGGAIAFIKLNGPSESHDAAGKAASAHGGTTGKGADNRGVPTAIFDMDPFIVNLADAPEIRYLKLNVKLDLERAEAKDEIVARLPQVRDVILILLSSKDAASLRSTQGKFQLRDEIVARINNVLPKVGVKTAYFTEFVVQ